MVVEMKDGSRKLIVMLMDSLKEPVRPEEVSRMLNPAEFVYELTRGDDKITITTTTVLTVNDFLMLSNFFSEHATVLINTPASQEPPVQELRKSVAFVSDEYVEETKYDLNFNGSKLEVPRDIELP